MLKNILDYFKLVTISEESNYRLPMALVHSVVKEIIKVEEKEASWDQRGELHYYFSNEYSMFHRSDTGIVNLNTTIDSELYVIIDHLGFKFCENKSVNIISYTIS